MKLELKRLSQGNKLKQWLENNKLLNTIENQNNKLVGVELEKTELNKYKVEVALLKSQ